MYEGMYAVAMETILLSNTDVVKTLIGHMIREPYGTTRAFKPKTAIYHINSGYYCKWMFGCTDVLPSVLPSGYRCPATKKKKQKKGGAQHLSMNVQLFIEQFQHRYTKRKHLQGARRRR